MTLTERIAKAIERITSGAGSMRVPAEETDPDLVLVECAIEIKNLELRAELAEGLHRAASESMVLAHLVIDRWQALLGVAMEYRDGSGYALSEFGVGRAWASSRAKNDFDEVCARMGEMLRDATSEEFRLRTKVGELEARLSGSIRDLDANHARIAELEKQVADLKLDLDARREFQRELNKRTEELKAFEFSLAKYAELEKQLREATEALGPAWLVGGASLAEGIKRKTERLESVSYATIEPRCTR